MTVNYYPNSLVNRVAEAVRRRGTARPSELKTEFPDSTEKQIHAALCNGRDRGMVCVLQRGSPARGGWESVWGPGDGTRASPFPRAKAEPARPPASVWELPQERPRNDWPPAFHGGRVFQLLGDWPQD